ncbi:cytochrome-c peroxidase [Spirosoma utsteinense]|uniref:Cytochrome c peroxidase n=1 Tax=Spirosoma utsteinense TaxID=2585773 RepID=A0ABR6W5B5_9BACT|nr:cytochrome c peroxidase [Spirosoma utsteinense]MBC3785647.1 cytochrome c peroxidase [Spirosoma utsteinense]MBC3791798.1 cytochrome c peroxidase [Spirosoma utsteinense]
MKTYLCFLTVIIAFVLVGSSFVIDEPAAKAALGKRLFFDPILSRNRTVSCATCHREEFAFADTSVLSLGVLGRKGKRNTPSAMNVLLQNSFFWDGRANTLEEQALIPIANPDEMDLPIEVAVKRLNTSRTYRASFRQVFGELPSKTNLAQALAMFQQTLETNESPVDDWRMNDNEAAVSESAKRGFALFNGKANCVQCHFGANFNSSEFRNIGLFNGKTLADSGRAAITKRAGDLGKFKIGPLRNVALTAPYMHNGMFKTLTQVIDYYDDPDKVVPNAINRDPLLAKPLGLTRQEKMDLEAFLRSLTDKRFMVKAKSGPKT